MEIKLTFDEVRANHPDLVEVLMEKMYLSKSGNEGKTASQYDWYYSYGITMKGGSFEDMIQDVMSRKHSENTTQDILNEQLKLVLGLSLVISSGRTKRYFALSSKPTLFINKFAEINSKNIEALKSGFEVRENKKEILDETKQTNEVEEIEYSVDELLEKISSSGYESLTKEEKDFLNSQSND